MIGGVPTSSPASLVLSLLFGLVQLVVGAGVAYRLLLRSEWRRPNLFTLLLIALWFTVSGATELFVSGMETAHDLQGVPTAAGFTLWRGRADTALAAVTIVLAAVFVIALAVYQVRRFERAREPRA